MGPHDETLVARSVPVEIAAYISEWAAVMPSFRCISHEFEGLTREPTI